MKKQNYTSQKGITLIALIITIIVMLILVGVTINVALNGGLFEKAETATRQTEEKAILEEMLAMMEITDDGKIDAQAIIGKMKEKYTVEGSIPNIIITGKLGTYNYIVSETEIKIGIKEIKIFDWKDVGLTVDTDTDYKFYDKRVGTTYIINFTADGKLIVKVDGTVVETYDATEEEDEILTIPFTYEGTTYDTTLKMNSNNIDVDAELKDFTTVTYIKETDFIAYGDYNNLLLIEISSSEAITWMDYRKEAARGKIVLCTDILSLKSNYNCTWIQNDYNIKYSKALLDEEGNFANAVYSGELDQWIGVGMMGNNSTGEEWYIIGDEGLKKTILPQEQFYTIIQAANTTN